MELDEGILVYRRRANFSGGKARARTSHGAGAAAQVTDASRIPGFSGFGGCQNNETGMFVGRSQLKNKNTSRGH